MFITHIDISLSLLADSGPQSLCVVHEVNKFTQTAEVLWRKRDGTATL